MSASFRLQLARRLLTLAALAAPNTGCGCGAPPPVGNPVQVCINPGMVDGGPPTSGCPTGITARDDIFASSPPFLANENITGNANDFDILRGPVKQGSQCCYTVQPIEATCVGGRPFLLDHSSLLAPAEPGASDWSDTELPLPDTRDLSAALRGELAEAWTRDGLAEHASIASFARSSLELLAARAPAELVALAHRAALDEVRHARLCLAFAGAYAGAPIGPGAFPITGGVEVTSDLASIAARAAREGCLGETLAAVQAAEQLARATDPAVRAALEIIAADEARHAELAWRTVVWAVRTGGAPVRAAVAAVLGSLDGSHDDAPRREGPLDRHGRLDEEAQRRLAARTIVEVVRPAARALLRGEIGRQHHLHRQRFPA